MGEFGPTMGPWFHRIGRGVDTSPVDATPWVARAHGREETYQQDLEWAEVPDAVRDARRAGASRTSTPRAGRRCGCTSRCATATSSPSPAPASCRSRANDPVGPRRRRRRAAREGRAGQAGPAARGEATRWCRRRVVLIAGRAELDEIADGSTPALEAARRARRTTSAEPSYGGWPPPTSATQAVAGGAGGGDDLGAGSRATPGARRTRPRRRPTPRPSELRTTSRSRSIAVTIEPDQVGGAVMST